MMYVCAVYQSFTNLPCDTTKRIKFFSFARGRHDHWGQQVRAEFYNKKRHWLIGGIGAVGGNRITGTAHYQHRRHGQDKTVLVLSCPFRQCVQNWRQVKTVGNRKFRNCFAQSRNAVRTILTSSSAVAEIPREAWYIRIKFSVIWKKITKLHFWANLWKYRGNISALSESFNAKKLCSRVSSRECPFYS